MPGRVDILEQPESLRRPLISSLALHVGVLALVLLSSMAARRGRDMWGSPDSLGGGSVGINVVKQIPLPSRRGLENPVANDTESQVPQPPPKPKAQEWVKPPEPDAIPLRSRNAPKRPSETTTSRQRYRAQTQERPNQLYSASGQALVSPLIGQTGSGGVGVGTGSPFGNRFGYYTTLIRDLVARHWRTGDVDPRIHTAPPVVITFTILRDGSIRNVQVEQSSGNAALDFSARRAIAEVGQFPQLPAGYERDEAHIEFWFELRR